MSANDEMATAHRRDFAAEREFRRMARDLTELLDQHEHRLGFSRQQAVMDARDALHAAADHIVAVWD